MKIGLVIYGDLNILSGGYLYDKKLVHYLQARGHEVVIFSQKPSRNYFARLKDNFSAQFIRQIRDYAPDLLLQDELNHPSLFLLNRYLKKHLHLPLISIVHHLYSSELGTMWPKVFFQGVEKKYLQSISGFIFNSYATKQVVENLIDQSLPSVVALPGKNSITFNINKAFIEERCRRDRPLEIIFVGNIIPRKSLHTLINSLSRLPRATWRLTIVGDDQVDPAYFRQITHLIKGHQLEKSIHFLGKVSPGQLKQTLLEGDILAVPSLYEGFGIVYVEALGAGLPVIAGNMGGGKEIIQPGANGYLVSQDEPEIADALARFIQNRSLLTEMSLAAYQSYDRFPTWEQSMEKILAFITSYINYLPDVQLFMS